MSKSRTKYQWGYPIRRSEYGSSNREKWCMFPPYISKVERKIGKNTGVVNSNLI